MRSVNQFLRPFVRQTMSPRTVQSLRYGSWCLLSYFPRTVSSKARSNATATVVLFD